ncbi:putative thioesterase [Haloactinopolyspora alba]|uniref:Putative thioesterase n=1 Tax=Haloactinopolyspora alba TaxID=648780 RepID=A0A2P8EB19_9ACTN|nr:hotdog domain-containing protein [Haloactinopolyspora alba]PSL06655.1 putative thioesterase [Haloactinopolyspora alba]
MSGPAPGLWARHTHVVSEDDTAVALGSGAVPVLGTPRLLAWMEAATVAALADELAAGRTSVGTRVEVDHVAPTPVGGRVAVRAELLAADERQLTFTVVAEDGDGRQVGSGRIVRAVVDAERFLARCQRP